MGVEVVRHLVARLLESDRITNCFCFKAFECEQYPTLLDFSVEPLLAYLKGAKRLVPVTGTLPRPVLPIQSGFRFRLVENPRYAGLGEHPKHQLGCHALDPRYNRLVNGLTCKCPVARDCKPRPLGQVIDQYLLLTNFNFSNNQLKTQE